LLETDGYRVEVFASCEAFLAAGIVTDDSCLLVDAYLPGQSGLDLLRQLQNTGRQLAAIMITGNSDVPMAVEAMKAGALDFLEKPVRPEELRASLQQALELAGLTARQREIMHLVLAGHPSKNIAADLSISQRTVENHRALIMKKTGSKSLPELARLAVAAAARDSAVPSTE
jgi:two-component system, chemotaxis family, CheB/CheR fusion protein